MRTKKQQLLFRKVGITLGILYFARVGLVPLIDCHVHLDCSEKESPNPQCHHHSETGSHCSEEKPVLNLTKAPPENHSENSSHEKYNCAICHPVSLSAIPVKSTPIPFNEISFVFSSYYVNDAEFEHLKSPHPPRGPPSLLPS